MLFLTICQSGIEWGLLEANNATCAIVKLMKKSHCFLLILSAVLYFLPFFFTTYLWWLIFIFPIPFLYVACKHSLSFFQGYLWGLIVFALHGSGGIYNLARIAQDSWLIGVGLGICMVLYQALFPALLFAGVTKIIQSCKLECFLYRLCIWAAALLVFIIWTDNYCFWIFGALEGYPLMHPLLPLVQKPALLMLMPIIGKQMLTLLFLLLPLSTTMLIWYKNKAALFFVCCVSGPWVISVCFAPTMQMPEWHLAIKSLPSMAHCQSNDPSVMIRIMGNEFKKIIAKHPKTHIIIMPESAFNVSNFAELPEALQWWNEEHLGKPIHIIFGACRAEDNHYYNSLHWVFSGVLQSCFDKKHTMLMSERLPAWMNTVVFQRIYRRDGIIITQSCNERCAIELINDVPFVPYICSELFFNEKRDNTYEHAAIIAIVNDMWFLDSYIQNLLVLLACSRALQWQRHIIYVSYAYSLFMSPEGVMKDINDTVI